MSQLLTSINIISKTESYWNTTNPIVALHYAAFSIDTGTLKIGDGLTHWQDLPADSIHSAAPNHASTHAVGGRDQLTPADIGAAPVVIRTSADWTALNPVCSAGTLMLEGDGTDAYLLKIGDGINHYNDLDYFSAGDVTSGPYVGTLLTGHTTITLPFEYDPNLKNIWVFLGGTKQSENALIYTDSTTINTAVPMQKNTEFEVYLTSSIYRLNPDWVTPVGTLSNRVTALENVDSAMTNAQEILSPSDDSLLYLYDDVWQKIQWQNLYNTIKNKLTVDIRPIITSTITLNAFESRGVKLFGTWDVTKMSPVFRCAYTSNTDSLKNPNNIIDWEIIPSTKTLNLTNMTGNQVKVYATFFYDLTV